MCLDKAIATESTVQGELWHHIASFYSHPSSDEVKQWGLTHSLYSASPVITVAQMPLHMAKAE